MIDHNKSLKDKSICLPEQRKLAQDFIYASWLKAALRKNRKRIPLRERSKKIFKSMKNALVFYKKKIYAVSIKIFVKNEYNLLKMRLLILNY